MKLILKFIYRLIPFKKQIFDLLKLIWTPSESWYSKLSFKGLIKVSVSKDSSFKIYHYGYRVENSLYWGGIENCWEPESLKLWLKLCDAAENIWDVGSNTGVFSLAAKAVKPSARVVALEPVHRVFEKLSKNIRLNNFDIQHLEVAASNFNGTAKIYDTMEEHIYTVTVNDNILGDAKKLHEVQIQTRCIDDLVKELNCDKIDLMKIDVESHEPEVLEGMKTVLHRDRPQILIEILNEDVGKRVENLIEGLGYHCYHIDEKVGLTPANTMVANESRNYLLSRKSLV